MNTILCIFLDTRYIHTHIISFAHLRAFFQIFFQECQRQKIKKKKTPHFYEPQADDPGERKNETKLP